MSIIAHVEKTELESYIRKQLAAERMSGIDSHVRECAPCKNRLIAGFLSRLAEMTGELQECGRPERRQERRLEYGEHGSVQPLFPLADELTDVELLDISEGGLGLLTNTSLSPGTLVRVLIQTTIVLGEVRYCREKGGDQYHVGIHVQAVHEAIR